VYEWDEAKREANLRKHGLDFWAAHTVYEDPDKVTFESFSNREARFVDVAVVNVKGAFLALVYTQRSGNIRVISFRPASRKERRDYAATKPRYD
jgi:uncharacterized DUF497 family protein